MKRMIVSIAVVIGLLVGLIVVPAQAATVAVQYFYITAGGTSGPIPDGPGLVQRLDGDGSNLATLVNLGSNSRPRGITIDPVNGHLYWNDWGTGLTQRSNLDGSNVVTIINHLRGGLNDIAVDPLGGKLYVSMAGAPWPFHGVMQYNLDGSGAVTIWDALNNPFSGNGWFIDGVGLDTVNGHVYFADIGVLAAPGGPHGVIRTDLNGANPVSLVPHLDGRGRGMAIDPVGGKMYFAQHNPLSIGSGQIWRANLNGTSLQVIVTGLERPRDVALDLIGNKVYWVDESTGLLQGANLDGSGLHTVASGLLAPDSITLIQDLLPPEVECIEAVNPHGQNVPGGKASGKGQGNNPDGFYQLIAVDEYDPEPKIYVGTACGTDLFGPYPSGTIVKFTEAPGAAPSEKKIGSAQGQAGAVAYHITLPSEPLIWAVDANGNKSHCAACFVPPPPK